MSTSTETANAVRSLDTGPITEITTWRWEAQPNCLWLEIGTAAGHVGLGETYYNAGAVEAVIHEMVAPLILGTPANAINLHWRNLFACANFCGFAGAELRAFSAVDIALWDLLGQAVGLPISQLLGGAVRDRVKIYTTCADAGAYLDQTRSLSDPGGLAEELLGTGITAMKIWPFDQFAPQIKGRFVTGPAGWSAMGPVGHYLSLPDLRRGVAAVEAIRDRVGENIEIMIEGHSRWDINCALRICRALEPFNVMWMEDIVQPDSPDDLRRLVDESRIPQAVSERLLSRHPYRQILEAKAAHIAMLDVAWTGGISESVRIIDLADTYHLSAAPHDCTGPITALANLHLGSSKDNVIITETVRGFVDGYYTEVIDATIDIVAGAAITPTSPGIGAALRPEFRTRPDVSQRRSTETT